MTEFQVDNEHGKFEHIADWLWYLAEKGKVLEPLQPKTTKEQKREVYSFVSSKGFDEDDFIYD